LPTPSFLRFSLVALFLRKGYCANYCQHNYSYSDYVYRKSVYLCHLFLSLLAESSAGLFFDC
jgi:hypothetical protein